jgi:ADP-ribose pyrophosphatase
VPILRRKARRSRDTIVVDAWRKLGEKVVYDGHRRILRRHFALPNGAETDYDVKVEPNVAAVVALTPERQVVLVREYRPGPEAVVVELPGGAIEPDETALEAARRELLEETGYTGTLREVGTILDCAYSTRVRHAFLATGCRRVAEPQPQAGEHLDVVVIGFSDFVSHVRSGRLTDAAVAYRALDELGAIGRG